MNSKGSIAVNGMGNVSISNIVIGNALGHMNRRVVYSDAVKNCGNLQESVWAQCAICHRKENGKEMEIAGVGALHIGYRCAKKAWTLAKV